MARRPAKSRLAAQDEATRTLAAASSLREAAPRVLALLGTFLEWELGAVWLVDPATDELRCSEIWSTEEIDARVHAAVPALSVRARRRHPRPSLGRGRADLGLRRGGDGPLQPRP